MATVNKIEDNLGNLFDIEDAAAQAAISEIQTKAIKIVETVLPIPAGTQILYQDGSFPGCAWSDFFTPTKPHANAFLINWKYGTEAWFPNIRLAIRPDNLIALIATQQYTFSDATFFYLTWAIPIDES